jgi:hypothetical protein
MNKAEIMAAAKALPWPADQFAVYGSAVMAIRGIREAVDYDVVVTTKLWHQLIAEGHEIKEDYWSEGDAEPHKRVWMNVLDTEVWNEPPFLNKSGNELVAEAETIDGVRFMPLARMIEFKTAMHRVKDLKDVEMINEYLSKGGK